MNLKEKLQAASKEAMKNKDEIKKDTIILLRAAILQVEKDDQKELTEKEMLIIVSKEVKKRRESLPDYEKADRKDIVEKIHKEIAILEEYMPKQLSREEIEKMIKQVIIDLKAEGPKDMGKIMGALREKTVGKADGKMVSDIVKEELAKL